MGRGPRKRSKNAKRVGARLTGAALGAAVGAGHAGPVGAVAGGTMGALLGDEIITRAKAAQSTDKANPPQRSGR